MSSMVGSVATALLATLASASGVHAQVTASLQGGAIHSTLVGSEVSGVDAHLGLYAGGALSVPLRSGVGLRLGAALIQRGAEFDLASPPGFGSATRVDMSLDLVQLQLLITYGTLTDRRVSPHVFGGVTPSFRVACDYSAGQSYSGSCDEGAYLRGTYFEALAGGGVTARRGRGAVTLDFTFQQGMSSIYDAGLGVRTRAFTVMAGAEFPLGAGSRPR
jgi:hypothetical protein